MTSKLLEKELDAIPRPWSKWTKSAILRALDMGYGQDCYKIRFSAAAKGYPLKALKFACLEALPYLTGRYQHYELYHGFSSTRDMKKSLLIGLRDCNYTEEQIKCIVEQAEVTEKKELLLR